MKPLHQGNWAWHGMAWVLKTSIQFIDISTCFRIRPKFYVDTGDKIYKTNVRDVTYVLVNETILIEHCI